MSKSTLKGVCPKVHLPIYVCIYNSIKQYILASNQIIILNLSLVIVIVSTSFLILSELAN